MGRQQVPYSAKFRLAGRLEARFSGVHRARDALSVHQSGLLDLIHEGYHILSDRRPASVSPLLGQASILIFATEYSDE